MSLPSNGPYSQLMNAFYGYLSNTQQEDLWNSFLQSQGLTTNPSDTDTTAQAEFVSFVQSQFINDISQILSPEEIQRRHLAFAVYDAIILLLKQIQASAQAESNALVFLQRYQKAYTDMIARVPIYIGGSPNVGNIDLTDPSKFTLGYAGITMQDVYEYVLSSGDKAVINSYLPVPKGTGPFRTAQDGVSFQYNANDPANSDYYYTDLTGYQLTFTPDTQNHTVVIELGFQQPIGNSKTTIPVYFFPVSITVNPNDSLDKQVTDLNQGLVGAFGSFMTQYANLTNIPASYLVPTIISWLSNPNNTLPTNNTPFIPWSKTFNLSGDLNTTGNDNVELAAAAQRREQKNSLMQQYTQNLMALRQTLKSQADTISTNLDTSRQAMKGQDSICASIIQQMKNIISSLFK